MLDMRETALNFAHLNAKRFEDDLAKLVEIPSVSTNPNHASDMVRTAETLTARLADLGAKQVRVHQTARHPLVYGEFLNGDPNEKTVLVYGHYDVQPPDPLDQWKSPPFLPERHGEYMFGRGVSDMKGQVMASLAAIESIVRTDKLPLNVKFIFEGEEEIGSPNLDKFISEHKELLASDFVLNPNSSMISPEVPTIVYALRGLAYFELKVFGPSGDLHSGSFGGIIYNPAQALSELIAGMHDRQGKITLPGFYDHVLPLAEDERKQLAELPLDDSYYMSRSGASALWGESGYTPVERVGARPTLDVNGLYSGFTGQGSKTVIPSWAMAKISMRLVPNQDPKEVQQQLIQYLGEHPLPGIRWELVAMPGGPASLTDRNSSGTRALAKGLQAVWGKNPVFKREGGSIPVVASMQQILGIDSVLTGFGLPDDNIHAPNERLHLPTWHKGIDALIHFFYNIPG